ncbi:MAG: hypothetical protein FWB85_01070 [Chitinispirillia bacterium]|nr:hypothetical protein [Chitinispirillia bacterium]
MKVVKLCVIFALAFALAWILIFTFTQPEFSAKAPIKIFWYDTPEYPMYVFAAFASAATLLFGFAVSAYYYIAGRAGLRSKKREIKRLEERVRELEFEVERLRGAVAEALEDTPAERKGTGSQKVADKKGTGSQKSVGERDIFA